MERHIAAACVPTAHASRYVQQLCKHWSHNMETSYDAEGGRVIFPRNARGADWPGDAVAIFTVEPDHLAVRIEASAEGQRTALEGAVASHLDRFAFREAPLAFDWQRE